VTRLSGGGDPEALDAELEDDPRKLAAQVPRGWRWHPKPPHGETVERDGTYREDPPDEG